MSEGDVGGVEDVEAAAGDAAVGQRRALLSPGGMAITAGVIAALFAGVHALGLRPYTAILSGTAPPGASGGEAVVLGLVYVGLYFACVIGAPILTLAAGVMWGIEWVGRRGGSGG